MIYDKTHIHTCSPLIEIYNLFSVLFNKRETLVCSYNIFPFSLINGIFPVFLQFWRVREDMRNSWQTSRFVRYFSPFRCGVRFCRDCCIVADSSSKAVKNETICGDLLSSISMIHRLLVSHVIAQCGNS